MSHDGRSVGDQSSRGVDCEEQEDVLSQGEENANGDYADKSLIRCSYSNDRFTVNLNSFGKAPDALHQAPLVPVTSRYLMARMSKLWTFEL